MITKRTVICYEMPRNKLPGRLCLLSNLIIFFLQDIDTDSSWDIFYFARDRAGCDSDSEDIDQQTGPIKKQNNKKT